MPLLCCESITMAYGETVAVKDVGFEIEDGDYLCIVGGKRLREKHFDERNIGAYQTHYGIIFIFRSPSIANRIFAAAYGCKKGFPRPMCWRWYCRVVSTGTG